MATRREKEKQKIRYADAKKIAEKQQSGFQPTAIDMSKANGLSIFGFKKEEPQL